MKTRGQLKEIGAVDVPNINGLWAMECQDGTVWVERPSENGNGWFAGDCEDTDNLIFDQAE